MIVIMKVKQKVNLFFNDEIIEIEEYRANLSYINKIFFIRRNKHLKI